MNPADADAVAALHVASWRGLLFVAIDPATDLITQLGDLVPELADEPIETYQAAEKMLLKAR